MSSRLFRIVDSALVGQHRPRFPDHPSRRHFRFYLTLLFLLGQEKDPQASLAGKMWARSVQAISGLHPIADMETSAGVSRYAHSSASPLIALRPVGVIHRHIGFRQRLTSMLALEHEPRFFESCLGLIGGLSRQSETFKVMERRLLKAIINPAMIVTWLAGIYLAWAGLWYWSAWFQIKFLLVVVLSAVHGFWARSVRAFARDRGVAERRARDRYR